MTTPVRGCSGKLAFDSFKCASNRAQRSRNKHHNPLEAYHCTHCGKYHIGEPEPRKMNVDYKRRKRELEIKT